MTRPRSSLAPRFGAALAILAVLGAPARASAQDDEAKRQFEAGVALLDDPEGAKYEEAYRAFKKAYELSHSPKVLGNIAFCALHLERDGEAIDSYATYLRDVPDVSERERAQIQRDLATMTATVARLKVVVKTPGSGFTVIDRRAQSRGAPVENAYPVEGGELALRVRPGRHTLKLKSGEGESLPVELTLDPGSSATQELALVPPTPASPADPRGVQPAPAEAPPRASSPSLLGPIVLGAAGLAVIATGAVTGIVARNKTNDIENACPNDTCPPTFDLAGHRSSAKTFGTVTDVSFIGGGVLVAGAIVWYILLPKRSSTSAAAFSTVTRWRPDASCTQDGCRFQLQRGF